METPAPASHPTTNTVATTPQPPSERELQQDTPSGNHAAIPDSAANGPAEEPGKVQSSHTPPNDSGESTKPRSTYDLTIVDESGNPIKHASVEPISLSINYAKFNADENGHANIPWKLQPVKWIAITKSGYVDSGHIDVDQPKPIIITLEKATD